jgi:hypothetical protein
MHRPLPIPTAVLAGALALGCADPQSSTAPRSSSLSSPAAARSPNASGGAILLRGSLLTGFFVIDEERGLTSLIGVPADQIAGSSTVAEQERPSADTWGAMPSHVPCLPTGARDA